MLIVWNSKNLNLIHRNSREREESGIRRYEKERERERESSVIEQMEHSHERVTNEGQLEMKCRRMMRGA